MMAVSIIDNSIVTEDGDTARTFGIAVEKGRDRIVFDDISSDYHQVNTLAERISGSVIGISAVREIVEDYLDEIFGI